MYLKSTHTRLLDGGHQWEVTLFCSAEANTIKSVDIVPKSRASKVVPNDAKPAPTAYTMSFTSSKYDSVPERFSAVITFIKTNERKTVSVPANMETDRKRRRADGSVDHSAETSPAVDLPAQSPPTKEKKRKACIFCYNSRTKKRDIRNGDGFDEKNGDGIEDVAVKGCCCACTIM